MASLGLLGTGLVCPCHVLSGAVAALTGLAVLPPAVQDGVHAVYVPLAVLVGAVLLRTRYPRPDDHRSHPAAGR